jgi:RNA polymerase sigma-70 factor (ECF subfamily)
VTQSSDNALVKRILAGHHEACVELIGQYHAPIYRLLMHLCRDAHWAEDLAQESFLAAWSKIGSFKASSSLKTWLHQIAYRKFVDAHRRKQRTVPLQDNSAIENKPSQGSNPYGQALAKEQAQQLYQAIEQLKPDEREVVVLHYLQGLSYEETAEVLDQPSGTVKWRTSQALERLRSVLEDQSGA